MKVLVTGGAGYVGQLLVPALAELGHDITVADVLWFNDFPKGSKKNIKVDIRETDNEDFNKALRESDCIIHLASIANDPSSDLNPDLTWEVNLAGTANILSKCNGQRFIYASSSSVYGICDEIATEQTPLNPLTRYSKSKMWAERLINSDYPGVAIVRPATLCGYSPRMRFDLMVNSFVGQAWTNKKIVVRGGQQYRSYLHVKDMVDFYCLLVDLPDQDFYNRIRDIFNVSAQYMTIMATAQLVARYTGASIELVEQTDDNRSYRISSNKVTNILGWRPACPVDNAITEVLDAIKKGLTSPDDPRCYNAQWMKSCGYTD